MRQMIKLLSTKLTRISRFAAAAAALALVGQITYLVVMHYRSQVALQQSALKEATAEAKRRGTAVSYFYTERIDDLLSLAESRELSSYFENKALGMSMRYGLRASLTMAEERFERLRRTKKLGDETIFKRIAFVDSSGRILIDSNPDEIPLCKEEWVHLLQETGRVGSILCDRSIGDPCIVVSVPYRFKGEHVGQVMGWVMSELVYDHFLSGHGETRYPMAVLFGKEYVHIPPNMPKPPDPQFLPAGPRAHEPFPLEGTGEEAFGILVRVENTPFSLLTILTGADFNLRSPRHLLYTTGGLAVLILVGMWFFLRLSVRNAVLQARLEETILRERAVEEKNRQLERESAERRRAEEEVRRLNVELEERVKTRTAELEALNRELEGFCHSVSHDLRAPVRRLGGYALALFEDYADLLKGEGAGYADRIVQVSRQLNQMIDALLDLARLTRNEIVLEPVNLSRMAESVAADLARTEPERNVEFEIAQDLMGQGDHRLLRVVFENLLGNAWKFTAKKASAMIEFGRIDKGGTVAFFIRDNGAGFDMAYVDKLFKPFQRIHNPGEFSGTGIGLASVQRIIERHGGRIWAEGKPGAGATFYFTLGN